LAEYGDPTGISTEMLDVLVNPLNCKALIKKTSVLCYAFHTWNAGESEDVYTVTGSKVRINIQTIERMRRQLTSD
jgi:hypothetical protein